MGTSIHFDADEVTHLVAERGEHLADTGDAADLVFRLAVARLLQELRRLGHGLRKELELDGTTRLDDSMFAKVSQQHDPISRIGDAVHELLNAVFLDRGDLRVDLAPMKVTQLQLGMPITHADRAATEFAFMLGFGSLKVAELDSDELLPDSRELLLRAAEIEPTGRTINDAYDWYRQVRWIVSELDPAQNYARLLLLLAWTMYHRREQRLSKIESDISRQIPKGWRADRTFEKPRMELLNRLWPRIKHAAQARDAIAAFLRWSAGDDVADALFADGGLLDRDDQIVAMGGLIGVALNLHLWTDAFHSEKVWTYTKAWLRKEFGLRVGDDERSTKLETLPLRPRPSADVVRCLLQLEGCPNGPPPPFAVEICSAAQAANDIDWDEYEILQGQLDAVYGVPPKGNLVACS